MLPHDPGALCEEPFRELQRLQAELRELESTCAEEDATDEVALHDAQLERVLLAGTLQQYQERPPNMEDLSGRRLREVDELAAEALGLREENARLAAGGEQPCGATEPPACGAPRTAAEELCAEVGRLRRRRAEQHRRERHARLEEWRLSRSRVEAKRVMAQSKLHERRLEDMRGQRAEAESCLCDLAEQVARIKRDAEHERVEIQVLNREVLHLREACYLPARLKRESSFLVKVLDQEGGRLKTLRYLRGLEGSRRLYEEVATRAPALLPLAGRAASEMEAAFTRYLQLEESHSQALQRLHLAVARGIRR